MVNGMAGANQPRIRHHPKHEAWPRWLRRQGAAEYLGISMSLLDQWVEQGTIPKPSKIGGVVLWDRFALDEAMEALFYSEADADMAKWDNVSV